MPSLYRCPPWMTTTISNRTNHRWAFWIDRGGTFTDVLGRNPDGEVRTLKLLSASPLYEDAAVEAMRRLLGAATGERFPAEQVEVIRMGATVATNALLERKGARTLLVTTEGFADALLIGDQARPDLFAVDIEKPEPLFSGVVEARERLAADGAVIEALDQPALLVQLAASRAAGFEAVAIAFLHADLNPAHERAAGALAQAAGFPTVVLSHEASPLPRFIARAETAVADAYLTPVLRTYVETVAGAVNGAPLWFMTSAGALARADAFRGRDAVLSGPAGGVVGVALTAAAAAGADATLKPVLGFDMGGTSTDVCRYAGRLERRASMQVAGARIRAPMLDIETVAAGGGSILRFDGLRARAGPESAGARPGPAAYGLGGPATVTDAQLVLGRLDPRAFAAVFGPDGDQPLDAGAARARLSALADAMGAESAEAAAEGFVAVAIEETAQAVRRMSTERGFDPRDHALVAFGGAAGQIACWVAEALGVGEILCPRYASLLSAWGIGQARAGALRQAGLAAPLSEEGLERAGALARRLTDEANAALVAQGVETGETMVRLNLHYDGSDATLPVPIERLPEASAVFEAAHRRLFGFVEPERTILIASVEVEVTSASAHPGEPRDPERKDPSADGPELVGPGGDVRREQRIQLYALGHHHDAPLVDAAALTTLEGPALIVRGDTQIAVAPGWRASADDGGLIRLTRQNAPGPSAHDAAPAKADPVTLELFNRRFMGVAEAMGAALERTAQSVNIKERLDFSCALFDADGGLVANAPHMPVHLGSMGASVRAVQDRHPQLRPGDAFALNTPYAGGTHLPDITVVTPVFMDAADPNPAFYVAARGHHADVGGVQPGSMPPFSRTIEEEGVLLDALPVMRAGRFLDAEVGAALRAGAHPARSPARNLGDLKAQIAACQAGAAAVAGMIDRYGPRTVSAYMAFVQDNAEAAVRRAVGALKDGRARVPLDGGGQIVVSIAVDAAAGEAVVDFTGTSAVLPSNFNVPTAVVHAAVLYVFRTLVEDDIPLNAGCLKPLRIVVPRPSMLAPVSPAAVVAGNVETSQHIVDALYMALGILANSEGTMNNFTFGDKDRQYYETLCGGAGASARADGATAIHTHMTNSRLTDPEILERRFPVRVERFAVRRGSGGAGARRGGDGLIRRIRFLEPMEAALLSTRRENPPRGIEGGRDALAGRQSLIDSNGHAIAIPGCFSLTLAPGDAIEIETPGGGGYGRPTRGVEKE